MPGDPLRALAANTDPQLYLHPSAPQHAVENQGPSQAVPSPGHGEDGVDGACEALDVGRRNAVAPPWPGRPPSEERVRGESAVRRADHEQ